MTAWTTGDEAEFQRLLAYVRADTEAYPDREETEDDPSLAARQKLKQMAMRRRFASATRPAPTRPAPDDPIAVRLYSTAARIYSNAARLYPTKHK